MSVTASLIVGYLTGSLPTADLLARLRGVDLRAAGTGNPGANNALRVGGRSLGAGVLFVEIVKGAAAVWIGRRIGEDSGGALAAIGATVGNVYNPWFRFRGGKGLAITGGILLAAWPLLVPVLAVVIGGAAAILRRSGPASLIALATYVLVALLGLVADLPTGWGLDSPGWLAVMAVCSSAAMVPKHWVDTVRVPGDDRPRMA